MIVFRQVDSRFPFLWEDAKQPSGRWHREGSGPAHYFADTPDGAWAEFLRHEEITDVQDLLTIRRQLWAVEVGDAPATRATLEADVLTGGPDTYERCRREAERLRRRGATRLTAPSAAMHAGTASGRRVRNGVHAAAPRDASVIVIFGPPDDLVGWIAAEDARPSADLLERVHHY
jgi:hypothetical protein